MIVSMTEVNNVTKCMEEVMPDISVSISFHKHGKDTSIALSVDSALTGCTVFTHEYGDIFEAYSILLGMYYGACITKEKVFDHYPVPQFAEF